jgi:hypothetical protein
MGFKRIGIIILSTGTVVGCGSSGHFANHPSPPVPINLTVYINDQRVSLSPSSVGAGPIVFIVTNQASRAQTMTIAPAGNSSAQCGTPSVTCTGPISPQATTQLTVDVNPGQYTVATSAGGQTEAAAALPTGVRPAKLHVGHPRPSGSNVLLQP